MLHIAKPEIKATNGWARLSTVVLKNNVPHNLWFAVKEKYGEYLCHERSDAFVLGLLHYAMQHGHDIITEAPVTDQLHFQLTRQLLPTLYKFNPVDRKDGFYPTTIQCPVAPPIKWRREKKAVGAGLSCGVDSLHVFAEHQNTPLDVTHACVFHYHGFQPGETQTDLDHAFEALVNRAQAFCQFTGHELIVGDTNFDRKCFLDLYYDTSSTHSVLFGAYALQKLFAVYHLASGYDMSDFHFDHGKHSDPAHYDALIAPAVSTEGISIYLDGMYKNRFEKVKDLIAYEPSHRFLNVCWNYTPEHKNCSHQCPKCMRTMLELDALGALEQYQDVFDVEYYRKHFSHYLAELYRLILQKVSFGLELRDAYRNRKISLPVKAKAWRIVIKKAFLKLLRGGRSTKVFVEK